MITNEQISVGDARSNPGYIGPKMHTLYFLQPEIRKRLCAAT